jgi:hypothetical protein
MLIAEQFIKSLVKRYYGKHNVCIYTDGGTWYPSSSLQILEAKSSYTFIL